MQPAVVPQRGETKGKNQINGDGRVDRTRRLTRHLCRNHDNGAGARVVCVDENWNENEKTPPNCVWNLITRTASVCPSVCLSQMQRTRQQQSLAAVLRRAMRIAGCIWSDC